METPTTDQLRDNIDRGLTGEKIAMPDPAAAPLGTDAEAAGAPPTRTERSMDAAASVSSAERQRRPLPGGLIYLGLIICVGAVFLCIVAFGAR